MKRTTTRSIILITFGFISLWILALLVSNRGKPRLSVESQSPPSLLPGTTRRFRGKKGKQHRIAIVIPFFGESPEAIPSYLTLFCTAASGSAALVDFLVIHNGVLEAYTQPTPPNVIFINIGSTLEFAKRLVRVLDQKKDLAVSSKEQLIKIVTYHVHQYPYVLIEFKPAIGHIFSDILENYSHWGYSDLDIVFGDLVRWITPDELTDYDIVTYGHGDQNRIYLRGQFTFHKNSPHVNQIWRDCDYLSSMDQRFADVIAGKKKLKVESAEACYSAAVLKRNDLRVKYTVKAFTDAYSTDMVYKHGLYIGIGSKRNRSVVYKVDNPRDAAALVHQSPCWFEDKDNIYGSKEQAPLQRLVGEREPVVFNEPPKSDCMYWADKKYQESICISGVNPTDTVFWIDGKLYKQRYENAKLPGNIVSSPFFHFQEWKRFYRPVQLATVHPATEALGWVLTKQGALPMLPHDSHTSKWKALISPLGHNMMQWSTVDDSNRHMLPHTRYCLTSGPQKKPPVAVMAGCFDSVSWQDQERVEILHGAPVWKHVDVKREVTLALTLQITAEQASNDEALDGILDIAVANVNAWQGQPCVLVVHMSGATEESTLKVKSRLAALEMDAALVALIVKAEADLVSRKALMNMASDAGQTRWIVSGLEIERGLVLSKEASALAYTRAKIQGNASGTVFVIPQFAIKDDDDSRINLSFNDLAEMRRTGEPVLYGPDEFDENCEGDEKDHVSNDVFRQAHKLWWRLSTKETTNDSSSNNEAAFHELALALDDMQQSFTNLLSPEQRMELYMLDNSPILMTDSIGPDKAMRTSELAREIEEFGGKRCYNGLRLAQLALLAYNFNVLSAAFAISTSASREAAIGHVDEQASGASRCDSCFMFDEKNEHIVVDIESGERTRPAMAAILWDEMKSSTTANI